MNREECVEFPNAGGSILRGILHRSDPANDNKTALICLNTGLNDMVGWHRIQVKLSRFLADAGYTVLRFDDTGIGDSEGEEISEKSIVKIFASIESGMFAPNADAAVDYMDRAFSHYRLVYLGFCGGALTALHSAAHNRQIAGIIDIGGPVTLSSSEYLQKKDPWEVKHNITKYGAKFFNLGPWVRFFTGRGEYRNVFRNIAFYLKHRIKGEYRESSAQSDTEEAKNLNTRFFQSFHTYIQSRRPILFYFADTDSATWEFKKYFLQKYESRKVLPDPLVTFIEVEKTNHIFSTTESQERMKHDLYAWLERALPEGT
jgi:pimeloyl-ACP methyl ester carboxylesterase